jgi:hypothetical protein
MSLSKIDQTDLGGLKEKSSGKSRQTRPLMCPAKVFYLKAGCYVMFLWMMWSWSLAVLGVVKGRRLKALVVLQDMFHGSYRMAREYRYWRCIAVDETKLSVKGVHVYIGLEDVYTTIL